MSPIRQNYQSEAISDNNLDMPFLNVPGDNVGMSFDLGNESNLARSINIHIDDASSAGYASQQTDNETNEALQIMR